MFTYLSNLGLQDFDSRSWKSNHLTVLGDHRKSPGQSGSIADIEFKDSGGQFTKLLIEKRHLSEAVWRSECPNYYIEVKATPSSDRRKPFYPSSYQYQYVGAKLLGRVRR